MAARNRPRAGQIKNDADEEMSIWNQLRSDAKRVDVLVAKSDEITRRIVELVNEQNAAEARGESPSAAADDELEKLLREDIRITEEIQSMVDAESGENPSALLSSLEILSALRASSEPDLTSRAAGGKPQRQLKRKIDEDRDSVAADSPGGPSPKVAIPKVGRLMGKAAPSRSGSVPVVRETSAKLDDGAESADGAKVSSSTDSRHKLTVGTEVFYQNKQKAAEGEGILCQVTSVIGEGKQRRYEIIDSDPDPPTPSQPYRASVNHLVAIPSSNAGLPHLKPKMQVLALYPSTTTFYKAEVVAQGPAKAKAGPDQGFAGSELKEGFVRLRFEGEEEAEREMDVERRFVLDDRGTK